MLCGIFAGITWALETVILGIALSLSPFISGSDGIFLAPFISTFIHDMLSGIYLLMMNTACGNQRQYKNAETHNKILIFIICYDIIHNDIL